MREFVMQTKATKKVSQLSIEEFKELVGQIVEEKLQRYKALVFYYDDDGVKTALCDVPEDDLPLKPEFEEGLRRALQDVETGRIVELKDVRARHNI
jgi:hypothetical protein